MSEDLSTSSTTLANMRKKIIVQQMINEPCLMSTNEPGRNLNKPGRKRKILSDDIVKFEDTAPDPGTTSSRRADDNTNLICYSYPE
jgi:hypothetical protein